VYIHFEDSDQSQEELCNFFIWYPLVSTKQTMVLQSHWIW